MGRLPLPDPVGNVLECPIAVKYENTSSTDVLNSPLHVVIKEYPITALYVFG